MTHTFEEIIKALEEEEDWGRIQDKKDAKIKAMENQLIML